MPLTKYIARINEINNNQFFINLENKQKFLELIQKILNSNQKNSPILVTYIYLGSVYYCFTNDEYYFALKKSDYVHLDGFLIGLVSKLIYKKRISAFPPDDYLDELFKICEKNKKKIFLYGSDKSKHGVLGALSNTKAKYPNLMISGHDGYSKEINSALKKINSFKPDILLIGLGIKNQENWVAKNIDSLNGIKAIIAVGNYIDILGGKTKLPPYSITRYKLRWLNRLFKEPRRLWKRYFFGMIFLIIIINFYLIKIIKQKIIK